MRLSYLSLVRKCLLKMFMFAGDFLSGSNQIINFFDFEFFGVPSSTCGGGGEM